MDNETYVLGRFENNNWSFLDGEEWISEVKGASRLDRMSAFELCEQYSEESFQVCIFKSSIFDIENCPDTFSF